MLQCIMGIFEYTWKALYVDEKLAFNGIITQMDLLYLVLLREAQNKETFTYWAWWNNESPSQTLITL